jgi:IS30 family transposase
MSETKKTHTRVSDVERVKIAVLLGRGVNVTSIARELGRGRAAIHREINRCSEEGEYCPVVAQRRAEWQKHKTIGRKLDRDVELQKLVVGYLGRGWTPERISGHLGRSGGANQVSTMTIYRFVRSWKGQQLGLHRLLPRFQKHRRKQQHGNAGVIHIPNRRAISERPLAADNRAEPGHWEADLVLGKAGTGAIVTLAERKTRMYLTRRVATRDALAVMAALRAMVGSQPRGAFRTITFDNGGEFARHEELHALGVETFFCDPYSSWQRGLNEHCNGLLRRRVPRGTDLRDVTVASLREATKRINSWPKRCLGFATPSEEYATMIRGE